MTTIEGNKLIAEFMGMKYHHYPKNNYYARPEHTFFEGDKIWGITELKYHSEWDWLMPVVEKIENTELGDISIHSETFEDDIYLNCNVEIEIISLVCSIHIYGNMRAFKDFICINNKKTKIEATWLACVEFIKWYNFNK